MESEKYRHYSVESALFRKFSTKSQRITSTSISLVTTNCERFKGRKSFNQTITALNKIGVFVIKLKDKCLSGRESAISSFCILNGIYILNILVYIMYFMLYIMLYVSMWTIPGINTISQIIILFIKQVFVGYLLSCGPRLSTEKQESDSVPILREQSSEGNIL